MAAAKNLLLDDRLLLAVLLHDESRALAALTRRRSIFTTGLWYYRLCHAIRSEVVTGALSGPFASAEPAIRARAASALVQLPDGVALLSLRDLAPTMAELVERHRLNAMSLEALASAVVLGADIALAVEGENPSLIDAAGQKGCVVRIVKV